MPYMRMHCQHCDTENSAFDVVSSFLTSSNKITEGRTYHFDAFCICGVCGRATIAYLFGLDRGGNLSNPHEMGVNPLNGGYKLIEQYPQDSTSDLPHHCPERILNLLGQASDNLRRKNWDSSGMASRKVLEVGTRMVIRNRGDENLQAAIDLKLKARIDAIWNAGFLTDDLKDWGHHIRIEGNEATHDDEIDEAEARELYGLADLFVRYVFMLPNILASRRQQDPPFPIEDPAGPTT